MIGDYTMLKDRLYSLRKEIGLNQTELAKRLGVGRTTYAMYEQGRRSPDFDTLSEIADYFDVTTDFLLGRSNSRNMSKQQEETAERYGLNELPEEERVFFKDWEKYSDEEKERIREYAEFIHQQRKKNDEH